MKRRDFITVLGASDFHTVVTKTGLSVTFKPTNSTYMFVTDNPVIARLRPVSFMGVQHGRHNTEDYNSDEVEAMARQVASEHASIQFCDFIDEPQDPRILVMQARSSAALPQ